ncbi:MAG TPA: NUDIX domain-containing protein [Candidatus Saccharimonadales bacterium]|nr:NUDIX domain-containing protein [Candidatus Saccharimonadales bacterium]
MSDATILKSGAVIIRDRKVLVVRSRGKDFFNTPGGKPEAEETAEQALIRELKEELSIDVSMADFEKFGEFHAMANGHKDTPIIMTMFTVHSWQGEITPTSEIEELAWFDSHKDPAMQIGSIMEHDVMPRLVAQGLID